jgi:hypothetical protein
MGIKFNKAKDIGETVRKIAWPNEDDAAQIIYEKAKDKESVNLRYNPTIYKYARRALTIATAAALMWYLSSCNKNDSAQEYNSLVKYSSNVSIQK